MFYFYFPPRENLQLRSQIEESAHTHKMELNNMKLNLTKERCELEQEKDHIQTEMNMFKSKATIQEANIMDLKKTMEQKDEESIKRVQARQVFRAEYLRLKNMLPQLAIYFCVF